MIAVDDDVLKHKRVPTSIPVLANDTIHSTEWFDHTTTLHAEGQTNTRVYTVNGPPEEWFYWFRSITGTSSFETLNGATSEVELEGFTFVADIGRYNADCTGEEYIAMQWATWGGGTVTITNGFGTQVINDVAFTGGMIIDHDYDFGWAAGVFYSTLGDRLHIYVEGFNGTNASPTVSDTGWLAFSQPPRLTIVNGPQDGTATVDGSHINYEPNPGSDGIDSFTYEIMTELGDTDQATVSIGTMDLDVEDHSGSTLDEITEDDPGVFLRVNNDDDNGNGVSDMLETGFVDDDLVRLTIAEHAPTGMRPLEGYFTIAFDPMVARVWHRNDKTVPAGQESAEVLPAITRFHVNGTTNDIDLWVEGVGWGSTSILLAWHDTANNIAAVFDEVFVTVLGLDYDIDSDNNNGFNFPDNSEWEEYLEDSPYGIGKLIYPEATHYTPTRLRLPPGLDASDDSPLTVVIDYEISGRSGVVLLWNTTKADPNRINDDIKDGGNRVLPGIEYSLQELGYDPASGGTTIWADAFIAHNLHSTKKGVIDYGKPDDRINAILLVNGSEFLSDEVKYMAVRPDTFYPNLQDREELRNALASEYVYEVNSDAQQFALMALNSDDLADRGVPPDIIALIEITAATPGLSFTIYLDHVSGQFVVAFTGTQPSDIDDIIADIWQGTGRFTAQYASALRLARVLRTSPQFADRTVFTGHSLGGGLASAAAVASGFHADTFNSAGLHFNTMLYDELGNLGTGDPNELARYANASNGLIDAYYSKWDLLSYVQDEISQIPNAIGHRIPLRGPLDFQISMILASLPPITPAYLAGQDWGSVLSGMVMAGYWMSLSHTNYYYQYGLMVDTSRGWDIYGYTDF